MGTPARPPRDAAGDLPRCLHAAVSTVSTAQILRASGYAAAEPAALRALSDIAGRYVTSLGRAASAIAEARGRSEPTLVDLTLALEDHAVDGFPGASDPARPVLRSGPLSELAGFVGAVREVPFAKPVPRRGGPSPVKARESFAAAGREPPLKHVPPWLPCFPEERNPEQPEAKTSDEGEDAKAKWESHRQGEGEAKAEEVAPLKVSCGGEEGRGVVPEKRGKVRFRIGEKKTTTTKKKKNPRVGLDKCGGGFERFAENRENLCQ